MAAVLLLLVVVSNSLFPVTTHVLTCIIYAAAATRIRFPGVRERFLDHGGGRTFRRKRGEREKEKNERSEQTEDTKEEK